MHLKEMYGCFFSIFLIHLAFKNVKRAENNVSPVALNYSV